MCSSHELWLRARREIDWVRQQLSRLGVREADLDDITQDVLVAVHRRGEDYDGARPIRPWLFGFAYRMASDYRKHSTRRHPMLPLELEPRDEGPSTSEMLEAAARRALVHEALARLDTAKRAIVTLVDLEERSVPEAAALLEIPLNTGYSRLRTARAALAEAVRDLDRDRS